MRHRARREQAGFFTPGRRARQANSQLEPAVIHTHRRKEHLLGALTARVCSAALVGTAHGRREFSAGKLNLRQRVLHGLESTILARDHHRLIAVSDDLADELPGGRSHAIVIPNSVDVEAIRQAAQASAPDLISGGRIPIGFLGRLLPVKQVDHLLEMMIVLKAERPGYFVLNIVGDGPLRTRLEGQADRFGLSACVVFHDFTLNPLPLLA
ncbi:MAG: glycosyltransferase, partial [Pseudomonadales bacterium]